MKRALIGIGVAIAVAAFAGGAWAQSQAPSMKIGFGFYAGGKQLDSGKYAVEVTPAGHVVLRAEKGGAVADLTPLKSLGRNDDVKQPKLVFDTIGSVRFLAEVWLPGQDGYQVGSASGDHEQEVVVGALK